MKSLVRTGLALLFLLATAVPQAFAAAVIKNVSLSPHVLLEIYKAYDQNRTNVPMISNNIFLMTVESDQAASALRFRMQLFDRSIQIVSLDFQTTAPLPVGTTVFNAAQIVTTGDPIQFNNDYLNKSVQEVLQDQSVLQGEYYLVLTPLIPTGPPYRVRVALFSSPAARNLPPNLIYPRNVEVTTLLPTFVWAPGSSKAESYEVVVSPNQNPEVNTYWRSPKMNTTQVIYPPSARLLFNDTKYYWLVIGYDSYGKPIGGMAGKSVPAWFRINSPNKVSTAVTPPEADKILRKVIPDPAVFRDLKNYEPVGLESSHPDLAELMRQLQDGSANIIGAVVE